MKMKMTDLLDAQLSEREAIIYLLVDSKMPLRDLATRLRMSHQYVDNTYKEAARKLEILEKLGMFKKD